MLFLFWVVECQYTNRYHICNEYFSMLTAQIRQHKPGIYHLAIEMSQHFKSNEISNNQLSISICMNQLIKSINNNFLSTATTKILYWIKKSQQSKKNSLAIEKLYRLRSVEIKKKTCCLLWKNSKDDCGVKSFRKIENVNFSQSHAYSIDVISMFMLFLTDHYL